MRSVLITAIMLIILAKKLQLSHHLARKYLQASNKRQKDTYDAKAMLCHFREGDPISYSSELRSEGLSPKLSSKFVGPGIITRKYNDLGMYNS